MKKETDDDDETTLYPLLIPGCLAGIRTRSAT